MYRTVPLAVGSPVVHNLFTAFPAVITRLPENAGLPARLQLADGSAHYSYRESLMAHADYPHTPGYLIDCSACAAVCHCSDATCVSCQNELADQGDDESGEIDGELSDTVEEWEEAFMDASELERDAYEASGMAGAYAETDVFDAYNN